MTGSLAPGADRPGSLVNQDSQLSDEEEGLLDLNDTPEQAEFRARARAWLAEHRHEAPPRHGSHEDTAYIDSRRAWQRRLAEAGLAGVTWPTDFGGQGLGPIEQVTANQEISRAEVPGILDVIGVGMLGPCLIAHGSEEQKAASSGAAAARRRGVVPAVLRAGRRL